MRIHPYAAFALVALSLALSGCGGDDEPVWAGPPDPSAGGGVAVDGFVAYTEDVAETWEGSAAAAAAQFLRLDERTAARTTIEETGSAEGAGPATVMVTLDGLFDDSIRAERWTLTFNPEGAGYTLVEALWAQACRTGRGHQDFGPERCI